MCGVAIISGYITGKAFMPNLLQGIVADVMQCLVIA